MDYAALKTEIETDPQQVGYLVNGARKTDTELLALLNTPSSKWIRRSPGGKIPLYAYASYLAGTNGLLARLTRSSEDNNLAPALQSICLAAIDYPSIQGIENIDLDAPAAQAMYVALVQAGLVTDAERTGLLALADLAVSRAEYLWGALVTADDLARSH